MRSDPHSASPGLSARGLGPGQLAQARPGRKCSRPERTHERKEIRPTEHVIHRAGAVVVLGRVGGHPRCDGTKLKVFLCFPGFIHRCSVRLPTGSLDEWRKGTCNWETG